EPYTIAMLLKEEATRRGINPEFQIFATDIDPPMIEIGRNAFYPSAVADDVPPELFDKYFVAERDGYRLDPTIRDMVRISQHNVIKDPPFSRLDLIVCRNVLIYFSSGLQQRLTRMMHHALKPGGHLFIGPSENLTDEHSLFERVNAEAHVFSRADKPSRYVGEAAQDPSLGRTRERGSRNRDGAANVSDDAVRDAVLARYTLPYVVVGRDGSISSTSGRTGAYIELSSGRPSLDLVANLREGLRSSVASMMKEVFGNAVSSSTQRLTTRNVSFLFDDRDRTVDVTVERMGTHQALVVFAERISGDDKPLEGTIEREEGSPNERVALLEQQLSDSRAQVRASVEQLETSNEELKSSNEEMMSMNEELQSSNEELTTINDELQDKIRQLASANSDIENFFTGVRVPVVFLASDGTIRNFTPEAKTIFSFVDTDHGRALSDIAATVDVAPIIDATRRVLTERSAEELAIASLTGDFHYLARVLPYKTPMGEIDGTVVTFTDVTEITDVSEALDVAKSDLQRHFDEIEQLYDAAPVGMVLFDTDGKYLRINSKLETIHGRPSEQDVGSDIDDVEPDFSEMVRGYVRTVVDTGQSVEGEDVRYDAGDGSGELVLRAYYYPLFDGKSVYAVGAIIIDMTEARQMEVELRRILNELQHRVKNMLANVLTLVRQAARSGESKAVTMETLTRRLTSLALTHDMLTQSDWRSAELHDIADAELVQVYGEERVTLKGPRVTLGPRAALSIGMTLHELATNALKHGGLKGDDGHVELTWLKQDAGDGEQLRLEWRERPTATETDWVSVGQTPGFGMRLIRSSIEGALGGTVKFENEKDGLHVTLSAAASRLAPDGGELLK
ncbi:MAG: CheR family methyltransferase, partial [Pseudomonadota bacterium]